MNAQDRAEDLVGRMVRLPVGLVAQVRDEAAGIHEDATRVARGHGEAQGRPALRNGSWGWFAGLGVATALRVVEPRMAALFAASHLVERHVRNQELDEFLGGLEQ